MAQQTIGIGSAANDGTGDPIRTAFTKCNDNFTELYNGLVGLLELKGSTDCSANPNYPAASKGDAYVVSVAGKIGGASGTSVSAGDVFFATADNAGGTQAAVGSSWDTIVHSGGTGSAIAAKDEGSTLTSGMTSIDFVGSGVSATNSGGAVTVTVSGGSTSVSFGAPQRPYDPASNASTFGSGFVGLAPWVAPFTGTVSGVMMPINTPNGSAQIEPVIYSADATTLNPDAKLGSGSTVTGVGKGINTFPFTSGVSVTRGTLYWVGINLQASSITPNSATNPVSRHWSQASIPAPSTAPSATGSTFDWANAWAYGTAP